MPYSFKSALEPKLITHELLRKAMEQAPRRICFSSCHKDAFKKETGKFLGKISFPFKESIKPIFEFETDLTLFLNLGKYWHSIKADEQGDLKEVEDFVNKYQNTVFLRDCLDLSIALSENLSDSNELTIIGKLENDAKYNNDKAAIQDLAEICDKFMLTTPYYDSVDYFCAVPPSDPDGDNLPRQIIRQLSNYEKKDISKSVNWKEKKPALKEMEFEQKLSTLTSIDLIIETDIENKSIIIVDDLYQSGTTMQYIAMKLKEAGASLVYGLSFVKARNDKDYV